MLLINSRFRLLLSSSSLALLVVMMLCTASMIAANGNETTTDAPTTSPTRHYGEYALKWDRARAKRILVKDHTSSHPQSAEKSTYTVEYCQTYCDQQFNNCSGFIKTAAVCKFMTNSSVCTPQGSGKIAYYERLDRPVTDAPTTSPTASPTKLPTQTRLMSQPNHLRAN